MPYFDLNEYRVWYDKGIYLDFDARDKFHAVQLFTQLCIDLNWGLVRVNEVEQIGSTFITQS